MAEEERIKDLGSKRRRCDNENLLAVDKEETKTTVQGRTIALSSGVGSVNINYKILFSHGMHTGFFSYLCERKSLVEFPYFLPFYADGMTFLPPVKWYHQLDFYLLL